MELRAASIASLPASFSTWSQRYVSQAAFHKPVERLWLLCTAAAAAASTISPPRSTSEAQAVTSPQTSSNELHSTPFSSKIQEADIMRALQTGNTPEACRMFEEVRKRGEFPDGACTSRLIAVLCHQRTSFTISKAQEIMVQIEESNRVAELVDSNSLGLLVMATAIMGTPRYSLRMLRLMLQLQHYPLVKVWSAVVSRLGKSLDDAPLALEVFDEICQIVVERGMIQLRKEIIQSEAREESHTIESETLKEPPPDSEDEEGKLSTLQAKRAMAIIEQVRSSRRTNTSSPAENSTNDDEEEKQALFRMKPDTGAFNAALNACANIGAFDKAEYLWKLMEPFRVAPNTLTFNIMIKLYARIQNQDKLLRVLEIMEKAGVEPDVTTANSLIAAFVGLGELAKAEYIIRVLRGDARDEENQLRVLKKHKFKPDVMMYTTLMKGYVQKNRVSDAVQLLVAMQEESDKSSLPNDFSFTTAIRGCARMGFIREARAILQEMPKQGVAANVYTYNALLQGVCAIRDMVQVSEIVDDMKLAGVELDVVSYNTVMNGHLESGNNDEALAIFTEMRESMIPASKVTYGTLMKAFARAGNTELVAKVFKEMDNDSRVRLDVIAWNTLIDAYAKAGADQEALKALSAMKDRGFFPTNATYCSLVRAFGRSRNYGELIILWNEIEARSEAEEKAAGRNEHLVMGALRPDLPLLDSLIDAFIRGGYFQLALKVVDYMDRQGIPQERAKAKYRRLYVELYANLYTSKHTSQRRRTKAKSAERRRAVEAFKFWLGLPNNLYKSEWRMHDDRNLWDEVH